MAYRSDGDRLRAENEELAQRLAEATDTIARLKGTGGASRTWLERLTVDVVLERRLPGPLDDELLGEVTAGLAERFAASGDVVRVGRRFSWSLPRTFEQTRNVDVSLVEDDGGVLVRASIRPARFGVVLYALLVGLVLPFAFATAVSYSHLPSLAMMTPLFVLSLVAAHAIFRRWRAQQARSAEALVQDVADAFSARLGSRSAPRFAAAPSEAPVRGDLDAEAEREALAVDEAEVAAATKRRA